MAEAKFKQLIEDTPRRLLRADPCSNMNDPKLPGRAPAVYVVEEDIERAKKNCGAGELRAFSMEDGGRSFLREDAEHGLLYLPYPYLVPGGRFNEMYGWDTAFPVFAWADTHPAMMREQVDNQLYQIHAYGKVLNANRTYYLSRSQPPLVAAMVLRIWQAAQNRPWSDFDPAGDTGGAQAWLQAAYGELQRYHSYWTTSERLSGGSILSRYWDEGDTPAIEVVKSEPGHYQHAIEHFLENPDPRFFDAENGALTTLYYRADRAMRASGLDPTGHWGYGGLHCIFHAPVCLNSLLYRMENDMAEIAAIVVNGEEATAWRKKASARLAAMRALLRDPNTGIFHDYNRETQERNTDPFGTFFHALWAGIYDEDEKGAKNAAHACLALLETPHGISTSTRESGSQWDHPYGWPPMQYFAFAGLARCGMHEDARRIAQKYVDLALRVYKDRHSLFEKYNVKEGSSEVHVVHGYNINVSEQGTFLWTAATLKMAQDLLSKGKA